MEKIGIIGLGYVGLPLLIEFSKKYHVVGLDLDEKRIAELKKGYDSTLEVSEKDLKSAIDNSTKQGTPIFTAHAKDLLTCDVYIVTVPTPVDKYNKPDLTPIELASRTVGKLLSQDNIVIYESTVYPGVTEDICVPILESESGLEFNKTFFCGYSPERINPGDKERTLTKIIKVTSGSNDDVAIKIDDLYKSIIEAGTYKASSIKVAEAAKVIENAQRDINIAFVNELAKIFNLLKIDTHDVLETAGTKWNFLPFKPGLVGGHCIGVDPYYLAQKAEEVGFHPEIILAGRRVNDDIGNYITKEIILNMVQRDLLIRKSRILLMGITFKENCPDIRNTKVIDIHNGLLAYGAKIDVYDPWANVGMVKKEFGIDLISKVNTGYEVIILAVAHQQFLEMDLKSIKNPSGLIYDVKGVLGKDIADERF